MENFPLGGRSERGKIGEAPHPLIIIRDDGSDLGLLEHDLGDEDRVGITSTAPWEIAAVLTVPTKKRGTKNFLLCHVERSRDISTNVPGNSERFLDFARNDKKVHANGEFVHPSADERSS